MSRWSLKKAGLGFDYQLYELQSGRKQDLLVQKDGDLERSS